MNTEEDLWMHKTTDLVSIHERAMWQNVKKFKLQRQTFTSFTIHLTNQNEDTIQESHNKLMENAWSD